jgi:hypothetical protein
MTKLSPAMTLLQTVWDNANAAIGHSWERLNHAMHNALKLAIGSGFPFTVADFRALYRFSYERWIGQPKEWCYSVAVSENNTAAAQAYEEWVGREPLIADGVTPAETAGYAHLTGERQRERLHVGCRFVWQGERVWVTSFAADGSAVACSYWDADRRKVARRYRITREAILAERAERKERKEIEAKLYGLVTAGKSTAAQLLSDVGAKTRVDFEAMPLMKLRRAAGKVIAAARLN